MSVRSISRSVTKALGGVAREAGDVAGKTMGITRSTTVRALRGAKFRKGETPEMLEQVMQETMTGALQGGKDASSDLGSVVKGAVIGTVDGVGTFTAITGDVIRYATRAAIRSIAAVDLDVAAAAKIAVEAGTEAGERAGLGHDEAASASAAGVMEATEEMDNTVAGAVVRSIADTAREIRTLVQERLRKPVVVLVDSSRSNAEQLAQSLKHREYDVRIATSLSQLDQVVQSKERPALVVIDLAGLDQTVWKSCERLQAARVPFLVIAHQRSPSIQQESIRYGARGVFTKPVGVRELAEHIRATLGR